MNLLEQLMLILTDPDVDVGFWKADNQTRYCISGGNIVLEIPEAFGSYQWKVTMCSSDEPKVSPETYSGIPQAKIALRQFLNERKDRLADEELRRRGN